MASLKPLTGVAHDIAHHAQSGLSWLHPHMGQACRLVGVETAQVELLDDQPYPELLPKLQPLELALQGLQGKFWKILELKGLPRESVRSVRLDFYFSPLRSDDYSCAVQSVVTASIGRIYRRFIEAPIDLERREDSPDLTLPLRRNGEGPERDNHPMIYTTGYVGRPIKGFDALVAEGRMMIDIRYSPRSISPAWRRGALEKRWGADYLWVQPWGNPGFKIGDMTLADLPAGWAVVEPLLSRDVILFCACHNPETCHRNLLIERLRAVYGVETQELP